MSEQSTPSDDPFSLYSVIRRMLDALGYVLIEGGLYELEHGATPPPFEIYLCGFVNSNKVQLAARRASDDDIGPLVDMIETEDTEAAQLFLRSWHFKNVQTILQQ